VAAGELGVVPAVLFLNEQDKGMVRSNLVARRSGPSDAGPSGVRRKLAGDFESPAEVIGSELSLEDKRAILRVWLKDLDRQQEDEQTKALRREVGAALASLDDVG
jgi:hypothetical protein